MLDSMLHSGFAVEFELNLPCVCSSEKDAPTFVSLYIREPVFLPG